MEHLCLHPQERIVYRCVENVILCYSCIDSFQPTARFDLPDKIAALIHHPEEDLLFVACANLLLRVNSKSGHVLAEQVVSNENCPLIQALALDTTVGILFTTGNYLLNAWRVSSGGFELVAVQNVGVLVEFLALSEEDQWGMIFRLNEAAKTMPLDKLARFVHNWLVFDASFRSASGCDILLSRLPAPDVLQQRELQELQEMARELFKEFQVLADTWCSAEKTRHLATYLWKAWQFLRELDVECEGFGARTFRAPSGIKSLAFDKTTGCTISLCGYRGHGLMAWTLSASGFMLAASEREAESERWELLAGNPNGGPFACVSKSREGGDESELIAWSLGRRGFECISREYVHNCIEHLTCQSASQFLAIGSKGSEQEVQMWVVHSCESCRSASVKQGCPAVVAARACSTCQEMPRQERLLLEAAFDGDCSEIERLVGQGVSVNARDARGNSAISEASAGGSVAAVQALIERRADVHATGECGRTPLWRAANLGWTSVVQSLLAAEANPGMLDSSGGEPDCTPEIRAMLDVAPSLPGIGEEPKAGPTLLRCTTMCSGNFEHGKLRQACMCTSSRRVLSLSNDGALQAWRFEDSGLALVMEQTSQFAGAVHALVYDPTSDCIISGGSREHSTLRAWKAEANSFCMVAEAETQIRDGVVLCLAFDPSSGLILSGGCGEKCAMLRAWQLVEDKIVLVKETPISNGNSGFTFALLYQPQEQVIISNGNYTVGENVSGYHSLRAWKVMTHGIHCMAEHSSTDVGHRALVFDPRSGLTLAAGCYSNAGPSLQALRVHCSLPGQLGHLPRHVQLLISAFAKGLRLAVTGAGFVSANGVYHQVRPTTFENGTGFKMDFNGEQKRWEISADLKYVSAGELLRQRKLLVQRLKHTESKKFARFIHLLCPYRLLDQLEMQDSTALEKLLNDAFQFDQRRNRFFEDLPNSGYPDLKFARYMMGCLEIERCVHDEGDPPPSLYGLNLGPEPPHGPWWVQLYISDQSSGHSPPCNGWHCSAQDLLDTSPVPSIENVSIIGYCEVIATAELANACASIALAADPMSGYIFSGDNDDSGRSFLRAWKISSMDVELVAEQNCSGKICSLVYDPATACVVGLVGGGKAIHAWKWAAKGFSEMPVPKSFPLQSRGGVPFGLAVAPGGRITAASHSGSLCILDGTGSDGWSMTNFMQQWVPFAPAD